MSQENVEVVRTAYERFVATREIVTELVTDDFVWSMARYHGWPEQQLYEGPEAAGAFLREWMAAWDDWEFEVEDILDAGDTVVALVRQSGKSKEGVPVEMSFAQVFTMRDGKESRMDMYSDRDEALAAAGLKE